MTRIATAPVPKRHHRPHVLRHSFATTLVRGGTDLVIIAEFLGHARRDHPDLHPPTAEDHIRAVDLLLID